MDSYNMWIKSSKSLFTDHKSIILLFTQKTNPNNRFYRFQLYLMKFPNPHIAWTAGKNLALPDTPSQNTPPESLTRKTTVEIAQDFKFFCKSRNINTIRMQTCNENSH